MRRCATCGDEFPNENDTYCSFECQEFGDDEYATELLNKEG